MQQVHWPAEEALGPPKLMGPHGLAFPDHASRTPVVFPSAEGKWRTVCVDGAWFPGERTWSSSVSAPQPSGVGVFWVDGPLLCMSESMCFPGSILPTCWGSVGAELAAICCALLQVHALESAQLRHGSSSGDAYRILTDCAAAMHLLDHAQKGHVKRLELRPLVFYVAEVLAAANTMARVEIHLVQGHQGVGNGNDMAHILAHGAVSKHFELK